MSDNAIKHTPSAYEQKFLSYIKNAGGNPKIEWFDDDHEPIGQQVRSDLLAKGFIEYMDDRIVSKVVQS